ncbi:MAG: hypothetical protein ABR981_02280 [Candidatus Micrarchaeaceae archaeon]|jgi:hypothetical protein
MNGLRPLMQRKSKAQSSLELLVTLSFGLVILLPIVILAFIQISSSTSTLAATESQGTATKLADIATAVGSQGYPAKQLVLVQVPPNVQNIYVGNQTNGVGHEIIFVVNTNAGASYITAYTPVNVSGYLSQLSQQGTYLVNVSAQNYCPTNTAVPCVYIKST